MATLAECITESFYAWEIRGRGWGLADYPVALEPPYRPFLLLPGVITSPSVLDDGRRPTVLSALVEGAKRFFGNESKVVPQSEPLGPYVEREPFRAPDPVSYVPLRVLVPPEYRTDHNATEELLAALATARYPVSVELVGAAGRVGMQIVCAEDDVAHVQSLVEGYIPEASVTPDSDLLSQAWDCDAMRLAVDVGLTEEFFLPIHSLDAFAVDPYVVLVAALSRAGAGEFLTLQVLFERVRNPWAWAITDALDDGEGGCIVEDAPEFLRGAKEKVESPLFAVSCRMGAQGRSDARALSLAREMEAFLRQYARPGGNALTPLSDDGYPYRAHTPALLVRHSYRTGMILSARELAALVHFPDRAVRSSALARDVRRTKALPEHAQCRGVILGENLHRGVRNTVSLSVTDRLAHTHVIGASGTGKSTLLLQLILQDIDQGRGCAVIDPHGDLIDEVLARVPEARIGDVALFDPADDAYPVGFNILSAGTELERILLSSDLVGLFRRFSSSWGDTMSTVLGNAVLALLEGTEATTLLDLRRFLLDERFRSQFLEGVSDPESMLFWEKQYPLIGARSVGPILSRLDTFLRHRLIRHIVGQKGAKLDLGAVLRDGKILLAKLAHGLIGEENAYLLGSLLVAKLHQCALARQREAAAERTPYFLYIDEVQHVVTPSMCLLLSGARKYGLGLTLAHQSLSQLAGSPELEGALLGNAHTRIVFRVGDEDAKKLASGFSFFETDDITRLHRGEAILRIGGSASDCNIATHAIAPPDAGLEERIERIVAASRLRYARSRQDVEEELRPPVETAPSPRAREATAQPDRQEEEHHYHHHHDDDDHQRLDAAPTKAPAAPSTQPDRKPIERRPPPDVPPLGQGGREHKYLQHLIKRLGEERGFRAVIEEPVPNGKVDVVLRRDNLALAFEISVNTDAPHELENLRKCLAAPYSAVYCVLHDPKRKTKFTRSLKAAELVERVTVLSPDDLVPALEQLTPAASPETTIRGYKVKVSRQALAPSDLAGRRAAIAQVLARSIGGPAP